MNTINVELDNTDLLVFERKPIYNLGKIQPYGVVLVLQEPDLKVLQVSTNSYAFFGIPPEEMLDKSLEEILDPFQMEKLEMGLQQDNLDFINPTKIWARKHGDDYVIFDGVFHRNTEGVLILELEPATSQENIPFLSFYHLARSLSDLGIL